MKITVITPTNTFEMDIHDELELGDFKVFCEIEAALPKAEMMLTLNGTPLTDDGKSMKQYGCTNGDAIMLDRLSATPSASSAAGRPAGLGSSSSEPTDAQLELLRRQIAENPNVLASLRQNNPRLADAMQAGDMREFGRIMRNQLDERRAAQTQLERLRNASEFDLEAQQMIAEEIRKQNVDANMEAAMEYNPEIFGTVTMLYINCKVNGTPVKAFVDSGAQSTIMSEACARRCNLMHLVDTRYEGIARGVGVSRIVGRVHMVQLQIENAFLATNFSILQDQPIEMLLGLDMLRRHQCNIDLQQNVLRIGTTDSVTPFLSEADIPKGDDDPMTSAEAEAMAESMRLAGAGAAAGGSSAAARPSDDPLSPAAVAASLAAGLSAGRASTRAGSGGNPAASSVAASLAAGLAAAARASGSGSVQPGDPFTEDTVKDVVALGFPREQAIAELRAHRGNSTQAIAALFAKSLRF